MAAVARRFLLTSGVGERLLASKLQILNGTGSRRPGIALSILTGRVDDEEMTEREPLVMPTTNRMRRQYAARTVYLSEAHLHDVDRIIAAWRQVEPRRFTRSAVLRRAVEHLRAAVEADPAKSLMENP
jgi:hypothetical protein